MSPSLELPPSLTSRILGIFWKETLGFMSPSLELAPSLTCPSANIYVVWAYIYSIPGKERQEGKGDGHSGCVSRGRTDRSLLAGSCIGMGRIRTLEGCLRGNPIYLCSNYTFFARTISLRYFNFLFLDNDLKYQQALYRDWYPIQCRYFLVHIFLYSFMILIVTVFYNVFMILTNPRGNSAAYVLYTLEWGLTDPAALFGHIKCLRVGSRVWFSCDSVSISPYLPRISALLEIF
jgi:hypothetical protein